MSFLVGRLAHEVGWQYADIVKKLETKRKVRAAAHYERKKTTEKLRRQAAKNVASKVDKFNKQLAELGY